MTPEEEAGEVVGEVGLVGAGGEEVPPEGGGAGCHLARAGKVKEVTMATTLATTTSRCCTINAIFRTIFRPPWDHGQCQDLHYLQVNIHMVDIAGDGVDQGQGHGEDEENSLGLIFAVKDGPGHSVKVAILSCKYEIYSITEATSGCVEKNLPERDE